eukprot:4333446-Pyramimonas_sp.AAC.1
MLALGAAEGAAAEAVDRALTPVLSASVPMVLGYAVGGDLAKLAADFPHLECFRKVAGVRDLNGLVPLLDW